MRKGFVILSVVLMAGLAAAQSDSGTQAVPAATPAAPAKPAAAAAAKPVRPMPPKPYAVIDTTVGKMVCQLFPDKAPIGVANFSGLASGTKDWKNPVSGATKHGVPLYDGTIFHRVIPGFMIQGGDPAGNGSGDPGYKFKNEVWDDLTFDKPGRLAYANAGRDTNGSQFFITEVPVPHLNGNYTIFGQCDEPTVDLVKKIAAMARDSNDKPFRPVKINHITVVKAVAKPAAGTTPAKKPAAAKPAPSSN